MKGILPKKLIILILSSLVTACNLSEKQGSETRVKDLANKEDIPEWLKLNVDEALPNKGLNVWIPTNNLASSSLVRVPKYPRRFTDIEFENNPALRDFEIIAIGDLSLHDITTVRNEQASFQVALGARKNVTLLNAEIGNLVSKNGAAINSTNIRSRYVKFLNVERARSEFVWSPKQENIIGEGVSGDMTPNVVGDPLMEMDTLNIEAYSAQPIWFTIKIPRETQIGSYKGLITIQTKEFSPVTIPITIIVKDIELPNSIDYKFNLDLWINPSAIAEHYNLEHWSEKHWNLIKTYLKDYAAKGGKNITTTITHEPWQKPWIGSSTHPQSEFGYRSMIEWTKTKKGDWAFDYSIFDTYVELAEKVGISGAINSYSLTPFRTSQKILYKDESSKEQKILEVDINDSEYKEIWVAFLKNFKLHLIKKNWFERTYLGFDEKPESDLRTIKKIIEEAAPEFLSRVIIAGHPEATSHAQNLSISYMFFPGQKLEKKALVPVLPTILERNEAGKQTTFYLCAEPAHPNTLTYSPAVEAQLIPWLALKYKTDGYLRWAYNNWTSDTFNKPVFLHSQGDDYYVYPGKNGPISSIRWELLKEGIEDYELYRLREQGGEISNIDLEASVELATRNEDGRRKKTSDMIEARRLILKK